MNRKEKRKVSRKQMVMELDYEVNEVNPNQMRFDFDDR